MIVVRQIVVVCLVTAGGWGCGDNAGERASAERIEVRLGQIGERLERIEGHDASIDALKRNVEDLERRLAAAETRLTAAETRLAAQPPSGAPSESPPPAARPRLRERRASLRAVLREYRERLQKINEQYSDDPTSPERQKALSDLQDWFRESRLAALRGEAPVEERVEQEPPGGQ